nr:RAB6A-GEF complex partner protein 1-like [Ipomoea batatas]
MYMAYGWPQVIPLEPGVCTSSQQIVYLKVTNRLLLVVSSTHLELWSSSQHRVRLGKYKRDSDSIHKEGENIRAVWSPDTKLIAVLVSLELIVVELVKATGTYTFTIMQLVVHFFFLFWGLFYIDSATSFFRCVVSNLASFFFALKGERDCSLEFCEF